MSPSPQCTEGAVLIIRTTAPIQILLGADIPIKVPIFASKRIERTNNGFLTFGATRTRIVSGATHCCGTLPSWGLYGTTQYSMMPAVELGLCACVLGGLHRELVLEGLCALRLSQQAAPSTRRSHHARDARTHAAPDAAAATQRTAKRNAERSARASELGPSGGAGVCERKDAGR